MKQVLKYYLIFLTYLIFSNTSLLSQDLHYSQFYHAPLSISPGLTGIFNGDQRYSVSLRDQWRSVPVAWTTFSAGYDKKFYPKKSTDYFVGAGVFFNYDQQGDSKINLTNINISGSYNYLLTKNHIITLGGLLGYSSRGFNPTTLTWDKQWNGTAFDSSLSSGEIFNIQRVNFLETAAGLNYRYQKTHRTKLDLGVSGFHLNSPASEFDGENNRIVENLPMRMSFYGIGTIELTSKLDLELDALHQRQGQYEETVFGGYLNIYLNNQRGKQTNLHLGLGYRTSKALFPKIAFQFNSIFVALSYDIDLSEFNFHTSKRGGPELHFKYILTHVKPLGKFKNCPIF